RQPPRSTPFPYTTLFRSVPVRLALVGEPDSKEFDMELTRRLAALDLADRVERPGVLMGPQKWQMYAEADLLCFPTFYEAETFGRSEEHTSELQSRENLVC